MNILYYLFLDILPTGIIVPINTNIYSTSTQITNHINIFSKSDRATKANSPMMANSICIIEYIVYYQIPLEFPILTAKNVTSQFITTVKRICSTNMNSMTKRIAIRNVNTLIHSES